jgi:hypothetical protein
VKVRPITLLCLETAFSCRRNPRVLLPHPRWCVVCRRSCFHCCARGSADWCGSHHQRQSGYGPTWANHLASPPPQGEEYECQATLKLTPVGAPYGGWPRSVLTGGPALFQASDRWPRSVPHRRRPNAPPTNGASPCAKLLEGDNVILALPVCDSP